MAKYLTFDNYETNTIERSTLFVSNKNDHLLIVFSSFDSFRLETETFDFIGLCKETKVDILFVRDLNNSWFFFPGQYFDGGRGHRALSEYITNLSKAYKNVSCIGSSMGGFASLYFGEKIPQSKVFALSPQLNITTDSKRKDIIKKISRSIWEENLLWINKNSDVWPRSTLLFGKNDEIDLKLYSFLLDVNTYSNILLPHLNHGLVHALRASGILRSFFSSIISGENIPDLIPLIEYFHYHTAFTMDVISPILLIEGNSLSYKIRLNLHYPEFWNDKKCSLKIVATNETINEKYEINNMLFYALGEQDILIENDLSNLKDGFYSCEISVTLNGVSAIDMGHKNIYIQVQKHGTCLPISIIKTGDDIARSLRRASTFI